MKCRVQRTYQAAVLIIFKHGSPPYRNDARAASSLGKFIQIRSLEKTCPHCGFSVGEMRHHRYGIQKLDKGWGKVGIPIVGGFKLRRQTLVLVYICEMTNLPFLLALPRVR